MADVFSSVTAAFSLAQLAFQAGTQIYNFISKLRTISVELRRLKRHLEQLNGIIAQIRDLSRPDGTSNRYDEMEDIFHVIRQELDMFVEDIRELNKVIDEPSGQQETRINRYGWRFKSVYNEARIMDLSARLDKHKTTLELALLSIMGKASLKTETTLCHVVKGIDCIRDSQAALQAQVIKSTTRFDDHLVALRKDLHTLNNLVRKSNQARPSIVENKFAITVLHGSAGDATASLGLLYLDIKNLLFATELASAPNVPREIALWIVSQLHALLSDLFEEEAQQLAGYPTKPLPYQPQNHLQSSRDGANWAQDLPSNFSSRNSFRNVVSQRGYPRASNLDRLWETMIVESTISSGKLSVTVKRESEVGKPNSKPPNTMGRIVFIPGLKTSLTGVATELVRQFNPVISISRKISTFSVHPNNSPIFEHLKSREVAMVHKMISNRKVSPNDRDENGNSLLWYAISRHYDFEMCQLLLKEGADPSDCTKSGDDALAILVGKLPANTHGKTEISEDVLSLVRLLMKRCKSEGYGTSEYKRGHGIEQSQTGLFHCALKRQNFNIHIRELIKLILENGFDLEARDINGNTPILYALYYIPIFQFVEVVNTFIKAGADVGVLNNYGEGSLHLMLRRLSACNNHNMPSSLAESLIEILVTLLEKGCDPTLGNKVGYTPIDAAFSPVAWPLFCCALERVGRQMNEEILYLDDHYGIVQLNREVEAKFLDLMSEVRTLPDLPAEETSESYSNQPCYLCGGLNAIEDRHAPFDEFRSRVADELGFGVHMMLCSHVHRDECQHIQQEDSCHFLDYRPHEMSREVLKERSWRRHVAYRMWREGFLRYPPDYQKWVVKAAEMKICTRR